MEFLLDVVEKKGRAREGAYLDFFHSLETAEEHLGHAYAASLLSGRPFASQTDINTSVMLKQKIQKDMSAMMNINTQALVPFLIQNHLLTFDAAEIFVNQRTHCTLPRSLQVVHEKRRITPPTSSCSVSSPVMSMMTKMRWKTTTELGFAKL